MSIHQIDRIASYVRYLQENSQEVELLFKELLIGVTSFFRDAAAWEQLRKRSSRRCSKHHPQGGGAAGLVGGLLDRGGSLFAGYCFQGGHRTGQTRREFHPAYLCHRPGPGNDRQSPPGGLSGQYRRGRFSRSPEAVFYQGRQRLPDRQGDPGNGDLRHAERHHGPAFYQTGYPHLPQPFNLSDAGTSEKTSADLSLQPETGRHLVSGERGDRQRLHRSLRAAEHQVETFPAARIGPAGRTTGVSRLICPRPAGTSQGVNDVETYNQSSVTRGPTASAALFPSCRAGQRKGDILYISGRTGKYLEPAAGKANWNIFAMAREGLRFDLGSAFQKALRQKGAITAKGLTGWNERRQADR